MNPLPDRRWLIVAPLVYESRVEHVGVIVVPAGFVCDLTSLPRPLWLFALPSDFPRPAVIHDWMCKNRPRAQADAVYREALMVDGMGAVRRTLRFWGVRLGGWVGIGGC